MPNRWTRVPNRPVPPLPQLGRLLLPLADLFMILLLSRPQSGSLRTTWVTPATLALCVATVVVGVLLVVAIVWRTGGGSGLAALVEGCVVVALTAGSACVAVIGILQRQQQQAP